jgi:PKD repeat protein
MSRIRSLCFVLAAAALASCREDPTGSSLPAVRPNLASVSAAGQVKWRFKLGGDYSLYTPGVGADGTVYVGMSNGKLYAIAPDGTQRWVVQAGLGGGANSVSVGPDGTIYVGGMVPKPSGSGNTGAVFAYTPTGTQKWVFTGTNHLIMSGPNVGPDGNIYAVTILTGIGFFSLTPAGQLRFNVSGFSQRSSTGDEIGFGSNYAYFAFDMYGTAIPPTLFSYDFGGHLNFSVTGAKGRTRPAVGPNNNVVIEDQFGGLTAFSPSGSKLWNFHQFPGGTVLPDVGPDNVAYTVNALATLYAINPSGSVRWSYLEPNNILFEPRVRPQNDLLFMGGRISYGEPGFFEAVSTGGAFLWRVNLPDEPGFAPYGQLVPSTRPAFSPDGATGYGVVDVAGDGSSASPYSFLYAIDLGGGSPPPPPPTNKPPVAVPVATCTASALCTFDGRGSTDDVGVVRYEWKGPSGSLISTAAVFTRQFSSTAQRTYTLTVYDAAGLSDTKAVTFPANQPPVASFTFACTNLACTFNGSGSTDDLGVVSYGWNFGDNTTGTGATPSHTYAAAGTYSVTLTVADGGGLTNATTRSVSVSSGGNRPPVSIPVANCVAGGTCTFDGRGSTDDVGVTRYEWRGPSGALLSTAAFFTRQFASSATRTYSLTVFDAAGLSNTASLTFTSLP